MLECDNCGHSVDVVATRWRCTRCGWKLNCCDGAPAGPSRDTSIPQNGR